MLFVQPEDPPGICNDRRLSRWSQTLHQVAAVASLTAT